MSKKTFPQGFFGTFIVLIFINDLPDCVQNISKLFADDLIVDVSEKEIVFNMLKNQKTAKPYAKPYALE